MMYTAKQAAGPLQVSQDFLRMKLRQGEYRDIGEAIRPGKGHKHWRYPCYPAKVAAKAGVVIEWEGRRYYPDGRIESDD